MSLKQPVPESPRTPSKRSQKELNLCEKVRVIEGVNGGLSQAVASKFGVVITQINHKLNIFLNTNCNILKLMKNVGNFFVKLVARTYQLTDVCY